MSTLLIDFPYKTAKLLPLRLSKYFIRYKDIQELDWYQKIEIDENLKYFIASCALVKGLFDSNKTLWEIF